MINMQFEAINKEFIEELLASKVAESKHLEYKEAIHSGKDGDVKDFLADICSFANSSGGLIIFGISEKRTEDGGKTGLPNKIVGTDKTSCDEEIRRIEAQVRGGIEPKPAVQTKGIVIDAKRSVIVIKVRQSFSPPHMVTFKNSSRFYARNSAGKYQLDVQEIRHSCIESESLPERIRQFRIDRLAKIEADETPVQLIRYARLVIHFVPINAFLHKSADSTLEINSDTRKRIQQIGHYMGLNYNFDGIYSIDRMPDDKHYSYCQVFRNGAIEIVKAISALNSEHPNVIIPSVAYERNLISEFRYHIQLYQELENELPMFLMVSLLRAKNIRMGVGSSFEFDYGISDRPIDRDSLIMPEIFIDDLNIDTAKLLKPVFDSIWQACGYERSYNFNSEGEWEPHS